MHKHPLSVLVVVGLLSVLLFASCGDTPSNITLPKPIEDLSIKASFDFKTTELKAISYDFTDVYKNIPITIYASAYDAKPATQSVPDVVVGAAMTDGEGTLSTQITIPYGYTHIVFTSNKVGFTDLRLPKDYSERSLSRAVTARGLDGEYTFSSDLPTRTVNPSITQSDDHWLFVDDTYSLGGIPESRFSISLDDDFLNDVHNVLFKTNKQESQAPQELIDGLTVGTLDMSAANDVWITFIDEKAKYWNNTLGYYTYPTDRDPSEPLVIGVDDITLVFPNASYGTEANPLLESGDTVYIGEVGAGQSLGFVLIANGFDSNTHKVRTTNHNGIRYSQKGLNIVPVPDPAPDPEYRDHASIMYYGDKVFLVGMEDDKNTANDYNFNDLVFAVVVGDEKLVENSVSSDAALPEPDWDGDGLSDALDAFPRDSTRMTSETLSGTLAYEDKWPQTFDYDFNDLVVGYEYTYGGNGANEIVTIEMKYTLLASGAWYPNGLALALPFVEGTDFWITDFTYSKNGKVSTVAEITDISNVTNDNKSQILIFEKQLSVMEEKPFNTSDDEMRKLEAQSVSFTLNFTPAMSKESLGDALGTAPYDVYMLVDNSKDDPNADSKKGREVHLVGFGPTTLANQTFLDQATTLKNTEYYRSASNLPFAIHIPGAWDYPLEHKSITEAYNHFGDWAESSGEKYPDWYQDKPDYRNTANIYR
ncbi:MAG: LruC domain-containing protein [Sphaerochaeta sp.]|nr:LruC domain-containing protein [Sphaerochaeta sp.]